LRNTDTTKKPAERFSILIVPRNRSGLKRLEVSGKTWKIIVGATSALAMTIVGIFSAALYYRSAYLETESVRIQSASFMRERAELLKRLGTLEQSVARTERFAAKVEAAAGQGKGQNVGRGPVEELETMPVVPSSEPTQLSNGLWKSPFAKSLTEGMDLSLKNLAERSDRTEEKLHSTFSLQQDKLYFWASLPTTWPTQGLLTSEFGEHRGWSGHGRLHDGIDIAGPVGTPINAPGDGIVTFTGYKNGYGMAIVIDHGYSISTLYGHCSAVFVQEGQRIRRGTLIAAVGNTGRSTGPHLHFEVHVDGIPVNPLLYLSRKS
jgi:murein DD-endopeptidase MepM/ murein hydrolase activator NlpD